MLWRMALFFCPIFRYATSVVISGTEQLLELSIIFKYMTKVEVELFTLTLIQSFLSIIPGRFEK